MNFTQKYTPEKRQEIAQTFRSQGWAPTCSLTGVSPTTLYVILAENGIDLAARRRETREKRMAIREADRLARIKARQGKLAARLVIYNNQTTTP